MYDVIIIGMGIGGITAGIYGKRAGLNVLMFEKSALISLSKDKQLNAYKHTGFWHPMDMLKDKNDLNEMWAQNNAPWKVWKD